MFSFGETQTLAHLHRVLSQRMNAADSAAICAEVRDAVWTTESKPANEQLRHLHTVTQNCTLCSRLVQPAYLPHYNRVDPDVVFVTDVPLQLTPSANVLIDAVKKAGFRSSRLTFTSCVRCQSPDGNPDQEEISRCTERYLFDELRFLRPQLIVAVGMTAASVFLSNTSSTERGQIFWLGPWPVMYTYAPAYVHYRPRSAEDLQNDMHSAWHFVYGDNQAA